MSLVGAQRRGQPLLFLAAVLASWLGVRVATWELPFDGPGTAQGLADGELLNSVREPDDRPNDAGASHPAPMGSEGQSVDDATIRLNQPLPPIVPSPVTMDGTPRLVDTAWDGGTRGIPLGDAEDPVPAPVAVGHVLLAMMGLSQMQMPPAVERYLERARRAQERRALAEQAARQAAPAPAGVAVANFDSRPASRWSIDGWLLLRDDSTRSVVAGQPSYGRSQAGAVARYRLAPSSGHRPQAYVRASTALQSPHDAEFAGGLSARPIADLPVRLAAEVRVVDGQAGTDIRPAAIAVSEFPPLDLPYGARAEAYLQGGYVGGDFATGFIDGQARLSRDLARLGDGASLSAGAGAWGGAQKGASRLDVGPSAAVSFKLGQVFSRLSVDYRFRVAGDAEPQSGPALTLSAGF